MTSTAPADEAPVKPTGFTHKQIMTVLSGLMLAMFLAALDQTIVATAMRTIADTLDGQTAQAWVTTAYLITATITTPLYGKLSDMYGRKKFYLFAITIFVIGSILCGTASSIYELAAYRAIQGVGAGGLMTLAFAIIGDMVPARERGRYSAAFMAVFGSASVLGPVLGGFFAVADKLLGFDGWRWIFYVNVPIGLIALVVVSKVLNLPYTRRDHKVDWLGAALLTLGVTPLLIVAEQGNKWGWGSTKSLALIVGGVVALAIFVMVERMVGEEAIMPLNFFRNRTFALTSALSFLMGAGMFGGLAVMPLFLQIVKGVTPTESGLLMLPLMFGILFLAGFSGKQISKTGKYRVFPIVGAILMTASLLLFATMTADTPIWVACIYMAVMGAGLGCNMQTLMIATQNALPPQNMGVASGSVTFFRSMGGTFGVAVFISILFSTVGDNIADKFKEAQERDPAGVFSAFTQLTPDQARILEASGSGNTEALNDTSFIHELPRTLEHIFLEGFSSSMTLTFLVAALVMVPAIILSFLLKEQPLREHGAIHAQEA